MAADVFDDAETGACRAVVVASQTGARASPGRSSRAVNDSSLRGVLATGRRWCSAQAGKPDCRAGDATEHRDSKNDTFHHGALLLMDQQDKVSMVRERRHSRDVGCEWAVPYASLGRWGVTDTRPW